MELKRLDKALACAAAIWCAASAGAAAVDTSALSQNGWFSDDTRADGSGTQVAGTDLVSPTLTDDPEATALGNAAHDADINGQISFGAAPGVVPAGTFPGAVNLFIDADNLGKSQISHRKDDLTGHAPGSSFGAGFFAEYSWMGDGTASVTAALKLGVKTSEFGSTPASSRTGENAWDKVMIYEPGNLNGGISDGTWQTETVDFTTGKWWFFDRTAGAGTIGTPMTLSDMQTSAVLVGGGPRTVADVYALITAPGARITSVQFGIGSFNANGNVYVNQLETNFYRAGDVTTFGPLVTNIDTAEQFGTIQAAISDPDTMNGHTIVASAGTFAENVVLNKSLTLHGAQAGSSAKGRVTGTPDPSVETIIAPTAGTGLTLVGGSAGSAIDGFVFLGGSRGVESTSGPIDDLQLLNNHFQGQTASNVFLNDSGEDITVHQNVFLTTAAAGTSFHLDTDNFDGLHFTSNCLLRSGGPSSIGLFVDGNHNVGPSAMRTPLIAQNIVQGHGNGMNLGTRAFDGGEISNNEFSGNETALGFGIQNSLISSNLFFNNNRAIRFTGFGGGGDPARGAQGNTVAGNQIIGNFTLAIFLAADQFPGTIGSNVFNDNCIEGNTLGVSYTGTETIDMENNWWGDATGPYDATGTNLADPFACPPVPLINPAGLGDEVTGDNVDYCPFAVAAFCASMTLEADDCQDDQFPGETGYQVAVQLWMRDLDSPATGFQAFLDYDNAILSYNGPLSSYSGAPFPLHVQNIATAEVSPGKLRLDGSDNLGGGGTDADSLLATLVFDVNTECMNGSVDFDLTQLFDSELSFEGVPLPTALVNSGDFYLDDTPPSIGPCPNVTMPADTTGTGCDGAIVDYSDPPASDGCPGPVTVDCSPPSGSFFPVGMTTVTCTATDGCGNESMCMFTVTVTATNTFDVEVELVGSEPATRCIHFVTDSCGNTADYELDFTDHDSNPVTPVRAIATIEMGCGNWTQLCAKDQQHTKWDTTTLTDTGTGYVADTLLSLVPGDDDDDGDVDINDITLILVQFGTAEPDGGCPFNNNRGSDFSNDGNVGSEDYSLLTASWLTVSGCACTFPLQGPFVLDSRLTSMPAATLDRAAADRADLNRDGVIDHHDVKIFEEIHHLPHDLSSLMRATERSAPAKR